MSAFSTPGFSGLHDSGTDDPEEDIKHAADRTYAKKDVYVRPALPYEFFSINSMYGGYWSFLRTGIMPEPLPSNERDRELEKYTAGRPDGRDRHLRPRLRFADHAWWPDQTGANQVELRSRIHSAILSRRAFVAVRGDEVLGFTFGSVPYRGVFEPTDLYVVEGARDIGIASALRLATLRYATEQRFNATVASVSPHYYPGKGLGALQYHLKVARGWRITEHLDSLLLEYGTPAPRMYSDVPHSMDGIHYVRPRAEAPLRIYPAFPSDAVEIESLSSRLDDRFRARSTRNRGFYISAFRVKNLMERGPAFVAVNDENRIKGYLLSSMGIPGVAEPTNLALDVQASSGETEARLLTLLHRSVRKRNVDVAMIFPGVWTPTFGPVLSDLGYRPRVRVGPNGDIPICARPLWQADPKRRWDLQRYRQAQEIGDPNVVPDRTLLDEMQPMDDPGEIEGRHPERLGFGEADRVDLDYLNDPKALARANIAYREPVAFAAGIGGRGVSI